MATLIKMVFFLVVTAAIAITMEPWHFAEAAATPPPPGCNRMCGDVKVPYPFGIEGDISEDCYFPWLGDGTDGLGFNLTCNNSFQPPKLFLSQWEIFSINPSASQVTILVNISYVCYNSSGFRNDNYVNNYVDMEGSPYMVSGTENVLTAVGCHASDALFYGSNRIPNGYGGYSASCITDCSSIDSMHDGNCSGIGCCQIQIPQDVKSIDFIFITMPNHIKTYHFSPCNYFFIVQNGNYSFSKSDLRGMDHRRTFPIVLDFTISNITCREAPHACTGFNSECVDSPNDNGYLCNCSQGYQGNPYVLHGCTDIDECKFDKIYPCYGNCVNLPGSYDCICPQGYFSVDPKKYNCTKPEKAKLPLGDILAVGIGGSTLLLLFIGAVCCLEFQRRTMKRLKRKNFENHGGYYLQRMIAADKSNFEIFSMSALQKATNNFHEDQILGSGGNGIVYRGTLEDQRLIAVKKSSLLNEKNGRDFANELFILSKVNHKNIVELLGCCLENDVPLLVYVFIPRGTLQNFIHSRTQHRIPFATRLRIATEIAEALKYLHIDASTPILHGDVKSANILLDEDYVAKLSDFGTSKLAPKDKKQFTTLVQGTYGYLDPEYMLIGYLTAQSDVYSFGVVIVELMTRKLPFNFDAEPEHQRSLVSWFTTCMENDRLHEILDPEIIERGLSREVDKVLDLAMRCLSLKANERPTMKEVLSELQGLKVSDESHPWSPANYEDTCSLLGGMSGASFDLSIRGTLDIETDGGRGR